MRRREFILGIGGLGAGWPLQAVAQQGGRVRRIAVLVPLPRAVWAPLFEELRRQRYVEDENLAVDQRGFNARYEQFSSLAAELIGTRPDAILCGGDAAIRAVQASRSPVPIVALTDDMVGAGLVQSLARPGSNTTGVSILAGDLDGKRQEVLHEFFPAARRFGVLSDAQNNTTSQLEALVHAARTHDVELSIQRVENNLDIGPAIEAAVASGAAALNVLASPLLHGNRQTIIARTAELRLPAIYQWPETARQGGLLAYGPSFDDVLRQLAGQLIKVLRGADASGLPVEQPTKFELVVNLKTANAIGIQFAPALLLRANEVIE